MEQKTVCRDPLLGVEALTFDGLSLFDAVSLLHSMILRGSPRREEQWREAMSRLLAACALGELTEEPTRPEVSEACRYLTANLHRSVTLPEVCRRVGVSRSSLLRAFAAEKQNTPHRYLEALRVAEAGRLLRQGVPPAETAVRTGFVDQSHLTHLFRALMGCPPGAYRQEETHAPPAPEAAEKGEAYVP